MSPIVFFAVVFILMLAEMFLSRANERALRAQGAYEPRGDVYGAMAWVYPAAFAAMAIEALVTGPPRRALVIAGLAVFVAAKAIKYWAIASLGSRWTFRVLIPPGAPLVTRGPYAWLRHPNYVGVIGELLGAAAAAGAAVTGALSMAAFGFLLRRRIAVEDRALGRDQRAAKGV